MYIRTHAHARTHTHIHTHTHTHTHPQPPTLTHTYTHAYAHPRTDTHTLHSRTHTHPHTHPFITLANSICTTIEFHFFYAQTHQWCFRFSLCLWECSSTLLLLHPEQSLPYTAAAVSAGVLLLFPSFSIFPSVPKSSIGASTFY